MTGEQLFVYANSRADVEVLHVELEFVRHRAKISVNMLDLRPFYAVGSDGAAVIDVRLSTPGANAMSVRILDESNTRVAQQRVHVTGE